MHILIFRGRRLPVIQKNLNNFIMMFSKICQFKCVVKGFMSQDHTSYFNPKSKESIIHNLSCIYCTAFTLYNTVNNVSSVHVT